MGQSSSSFESPPSSKDTQLKNPSPNALQMETMVRQAHQPSESNWSLFRDVLASLGIKYMWLEPRLPINPSAPKLNTMLSYSECNILADMYNRCYTNKKRDCLFIQDFMTARGCFTKQSSHPDT